MTLSTGDPRRCLHASLAVNAAVNTANLDASFLSRRGSRVCIVAMFDRNGAEVQRLELSGVQFQMCTNCWQEQRSDGTGSTRLSERPQASEPHAQIRGAFNSKLV
jgi:hypothetical protein